MNFGFLFNFWLLLYQRSTESRAGGVRSSNSQTAGVSIQPTQTSARRPIKLNAFRGRSTGRSEVALS